MCNNENKCCVSMDIFRATVEKLIWSVCINYAGEQITIDKACELLNITSDEFTALFETFPYEQKPISIDEVRWLD